jgi:hypothetical protein
MGCVWLKSIHIMIKVKQVTSQFPANSLTESDLLALGDDVDAELGTCVLGGGDTCNSKGLEHAQNRQL